MGGGENFQFQNSNTLLCDPVMLMVVFFLWGLHFQICYSKLRNLELKIQFFKMKNAISREINVYNFFKKKK